MENGKGSTVTGNSEMILTNTKGKRQNGNRCPPKATWPWRNGNILQLVYFKVSRCDTVAMVLAATRGHVTWMYQCDGAEECGKKWDGLDERGQQTRGITESQNHTQTQSHTLSQNHRIAHYFTESHTSAESYTITEIHTIRESHTILQNHTLLIITNYRILSPAPRGPSNTL